MSGELKIRTAGIADAAELLKIYAPYVENTAISFEYEVPSVEEFRDRIRKTLERYPYIVAEKNGEILGYAYVSTFHARRAYDWSVETSIYIRQDQKGRGLGKKMYLALEDILKKQHVSNLYACIAYTEQEDAHLTNDSMRFHAHLGYRLAGTFRKCGYKFGKWYDMIWMEKMIGEHPDEPEEFIRFPELSDKSCFRGKAML